MTNSDLRKRYNALFDYHILVAHEGKTIVIGTYKKPGTTTVLFGYSPELEDFIKVPNENILCTIRLTTQKSKA